MPVAALRPSCFWTKNNLEVLDRALLEGKRKVQTTARPGISGFLFDLSQPDGYQIALLGSPLLSEITKEASKLKIS